MLWVLNTLCEGESKMTLRDLQVGRSATILKNNMSGALKQRFMDMGITKGVTVKVLKIAPLGDPIEIELRGYNLSIRKCDAQNIEIKEV